MCIGTVPGMEGLPARASLALRVGYADAQAVFTALPGRLGAPAGGSCSSCACMMLQHRREFCVCIPGLCSQGGLQGFCSVLGGVSHGPSGHLCECVCAGMCAFVRERLNRTCIPAHLRHVRPQRACKNSSHGASWSLLQGHGWACEEVRFTPQAGQCEAPPVAVHGLIYIPKPQTKHLMQKCRLRHIYVHETNQVSQVCMGRLEYCSSSGEMHHGSIKELWCGWHEAPQYIQRNAAAPLPKVDE